jgi:hypothetical protein
MAPKGEMTPRPISLYERMAENIPPSMSEVPFTHEEYRQRLQRVDFQALSGWKCGVIARFGQ